jgi:hypothetical protein
MLFGSWKLFRLAGAFRETCRARFGDRGGLSHAPTASIRHCPLGRWVKVDDLFRFMIAAGFDFEVTRQPWDLYISDPHYGSLGHEGYHDWEILQGRYTLCLLFEYAATLGMIDVAYVHPAGVRHDFRAL